MHTFAAMRPRDQARQVHSKTKGPTNALRWWGFFRLMWSQERHPYMAMNAEEFGQAGLAVSAAMLSNA